MENTKKMNLTTKIFIALILGVVTGLILHPIKENPMVEKYLLNFIFNFLGNGFVRAIRMVVVPLVLCSLVMGSAGIEDVTKLGRIGIKTLAFYLSTTAFAVVLALVGGNIINPGKGIQLENIATTAVKTPETKPFVDILLDMIPINPIEALATGNMLQIIVFAILLGVALSLLGEKASNVKKLFEEGNSISLKLVELIMKLAPLGVYGLIAKTFTTLGYVALIPLFKYFIGVVIILFIHCLVTYQGILVLFGKYNPIKFFKGFAPTMMIGFSTASSSACLPSSLKTVQENFGVSKTISSFTIPLGNTINMDGTAVMQGIATIFIAQIYGKDLTMAHYISIILTATLASIGTAGVPGVGVIMLGMVLVQVGLPLEGIGLVMGIDRFVDMFRTMINITGDAVCTLVIAKTEGEQLK
ncbi:MULTISPECIES: dicarboxylate/amino acid:cation symporter [Fusobacterium]|uniref:dicarboxylate/amino acid:cation symporter n=1 Tax=Fusobacterium TaxID=848 RepID=UPI001F32899C|nr:MULTISPECIES: dicarboxylate/amino acid:cation symporter [Fusobacterium]MCF2612895.1 dicarboxylate/amino acid:cation symporter [Fusobacterium perfoetens]MDY2981057.1 dicarboxylate/amino acid:cation symporter [Fusobacterium sp.]